MSISACNLYLYCNQHNSRLVHATCFCLRRYAALADSWARLSHADLQVGVPPPPPFYLTQQARLFRYLVFQRTVLRQQRRCKITSEIQTKKVLSIFAIYAIFWVRYSYYADTAASNMFCYFSMVLFTNLFQHDLIINSFESKNHVRFLSFKSRDLLRLYFIYF